MLRRRSSDSGLIAQLAAIAAAEGGPTTKGVPDRWRHSPTWRCPAAHVSTRSGEGRRPRCVFCGSDVVATFPEDRSGPLPTNDRWLEAARAGSSSFVPRQSRHADFGSIGGEPVERDGITASPLMFRSDDPAVVEAGVAPSRSPRIGLRRPR